MDVLDVVSGRERRCEMEKALFSSSSAREEKVENESTTRDGRVAFGRPACTAYANHVGRRGGALRDDWV